MCNNSKGIHPDEKRVYHRLKFGSPDHSQRPLMIRMLSEKGLILRMMKFAVGLPNRLNTTCRRILEEEIFPHYRDRKDISRILFVGCDWYTYHYRKEFDHPKKFITIDPDLKKIKFGSKFHVVAPLEELDRHFPKEYFDLIICNGVFGDGLNERQQCELAFDLCYQHLRTGGEFVLGWDDIPNKPPFNLDSLDSLRRFQRNNSSCLGEWRYRTETPYNHTFDFYIK